MAIQAARQWDWPCVLIAAIAVVTVNCDLSVSLGSDSPAAESAMLRLLEVTSAQGRSALTEAGRRHDVARGIAPEDPRVPYAYGVVLANLHQLGAAQQQFTAARETDQPPFPPAWRAGLTLALLQRQWLPAADLAERFGRVLGDPAAAWPRPEDQLRDARWLGSAVAAAQSLVVQVDEVKRWLTVDAQIRQGLPAVVRTAYEAGFDATLDEHAKLSAALEIARNAARDDQELQQMVEQQRARDQKRVNDNTRGQLQVVAAGQEKSFEEQMVEFGKQLGTLEREWNRLSNRRQALQRSILLVEQEIFLLRQQLDMVSQQNQGNLTPGFRTPRPGLAASIDQQIGVRVNQLLQYQAEDGRTLAEMVPVQQRAMAVLAERQAATQEHERRTGELTARDEQLEKWKQQLEKKIVELDAPAKGLSPEVKALEQRLKNLGTYIPVNWNAERERFLQDLSAKK